MATPLFDTIAVIGLGLIGSSFSQAVRRGSLTRQILGFDTSESVRSSAVQLGLVDEILSPGSSELSKADLIFLSTPVSAMKSAFSSIMNHLKPGTIITDVGSTKLSVISEIDKLFPPSVHFIPAHPIVGAEHSGSEAGFAKLFENRFCILTPTPNTDQNAIESVEVLWKAIGCNVEIMTAEHHDRVFAMTGNLPHLIASTIFGTAIDSEETTRKEVVKFSAAEFGDFTRLAAFEPGIWADLHLHNKQPLLEMLTRFSEDLGAVQRAIRWGEHDFLLAFFQRIRTARETMIDMNQETSKPSIARPEAFVGSNAELMRLRSESGSLRSLELPINLVSQNVVSLIDQQREITRGNNKLDPQSRDEQLSALDSLKEIVKEAQSLPDRLEQGDIVAETWMARFKSEFEDNFAQTFGAKNIAKATLPAAIILGCGALGALVAGPVGFGAGSVLGHLITGQIKPGAAADKVSDALNTDETDT